MVNALESIVGPVFIGQVTDDEARVVYQNTDFGPRISRNSWPEICILINYSSFIISDLADKNRPDYAFQSINHVLRTLKILKHIPGYKPHRLAGHQHLSWKVAYVCLLAYLLF